MLHVSSDWATLAGSSPTAFFFTTILPIWLFGLVTGIVAPRQPVLSDVRAFAGTAAVGALSFGARATLLSQIITFINGVIFVQSLWYRFTERGTFRRLCATAARKVGVGKAEAGVPRQVPPPASDWYVTEDDLETFLQRTGPDPVPNAGPWEPVVDKEIPGMVKYQSQRRTLRDIRKTEYLSVSLTADTTPHEVMDFYLSDPARQQWDNLLTHAETIEDGAFADRKQVVHWVRSFPFAFLSDRSYIIARRMFERNGVLYGVSKVIDYPGHDSGNTVRMRNYWSMWSIEPCPCPYGTGRPATRTALLHMEDFMIPENLSRFAVKCGMWGFIKQMSPHLVQFCATRRAAGVHGDLHDPHAFGSPLGPRPIAGARAGAVAAPRRAQQPQQPRNRFARALANRGPMLKRIASAVVAGGMLVALGSASKQHADKGRRAEKGRGGQFRLRGFGRS